MKHLIGVSLGSVSSVGKFVLYGLKNAVKYSAATIKASKFSTAIANNIKNISETTGNWRVFDDEKMTTKEYTEMAGIIAAYKNKINNNHDDLPKFFIMENQKPCITQEEILEAFIFNGEDKYGLIGDMNLFVKVITRFSKLRGKKYSFYVNGACNLFCAELADWAKYIIRNGYYEGIIDELNNRKNYLSHFIELSDLFNNEVDRDDSIYRLIDNLLIILKKGAIPNACIYADKRNASNYLANIQKNLKLCFSSLEKGFYYLYANDEDLQDNHHYNYDSRLQNKILDETSFGKIFQLVGKAFSLLEKNKTVLEPVFSNQCTPEDWLFKFMVEFSEESGLHPYFAHRTERIELFLKSIKFLNDFSYLAQAFCQANSLANYSGNIIIYLQLSKTMKELFSCFYEATKQMHALINDTMTMADELNHWITEKGDYHNYWALNNHMLSKYHLRKANNTLKKISTQMILLSGEVRSAQSVEYQKEMHGKVMQYRGFLDILCDRLSITPRAKQETVPNELNLLLEPATQINEKIELIELIEQPNSLDIEERIQNNITSNQAVSFYTTVPENIKSLPIEERINNILNL